MQVPVTGIKNKKSEYRMRNLFLIDGREPNEELGHTVLLNTALKKFPTWNSSEH